MGLSCAGAPIFDGDGRFAAVLDVSSLNPDAARRSHGLALAATAAAARAVEERLFRGRFHDAWVLATAPADDSGAAILFAVNTDRKIVGADRVARAKCGLTAGNLKDGLDLSTVFDDHSMLLLSAGPDDVAVRLTRQGDPWNVLVTPPDPSFRRRRLMLNGVDHLRPRIATLGHLRQPLQLPGSARGGLPPRTIALVTGYIDAHLDLNIRTDTLAAIAQLSPFHFSRAFKQSFGLAPHEYLLRRRIERATRLLRDTKLPLSEIALAVGFSDHSHFSRLFRRETGVPPSAIRTEPGRYPI